jgi:CubicO group peptidase (beta-lactamase class C family)
MAVLLRCTLMTAAALLATTTAGAQRSYAPNARVDSVFARYDRPDIPGCVVGVYKDDAIEYARGYGSANLEHRIALTPQSVLDIASVSKQFTAAVVTLLAQEGRLSLDDDIRKYIPELPDYGHTITLRHLFHHTSGLRDYVRLLVLSGHREDDVTTDEDALTVIVRQKALNFPPGTEFLYGSTGYFLMSLVVQRVTGAPLHVVARERLFAPLGMRQTHFLTSYNAVVPARATGYSPLNDSGFRADMPRWLQIGDGGVWTSIEELFRWEKNFYDARIGGRAMIDTLEQPGRQTSRQSTNYGLGLSITSYRGHRAVGHSGHWGGYVSQLTRYPDQRLSVAVLCNRSDADPDVYAIQVADIFLPVPSAAATAGASTPPLLSALPEVSLPPNALPLLVGTFRGNAPDMTAVVDQGKLHLSVEGQRYELRHIGSYRFEVMGTPIEASIRFDLAGVEPARSFQWQGVKGEFTMVRVDQPHKTSVSVVALQEFVGRYFSEELQSTIEISASDSGMIVRGPGIRSPVFVMAAPDEFRSDISIRFTRRPDGSISGFALSTERSRNMRFDRVVSPR